MCKFCEPALRREAVLRTQHFYVVVDRAPVTEGHVLVISNEHRDNLWSLTRHEWNDLWDALRHAQQYVDAMHHPSGANVGTNIGADAGQTVMHFHMHVIPRHKGDVDDPRGGVRNIMKPLKELLPEE